MGGNYSLEQRESLEAHIIQVFDETIKLLDQIKFVDGGGGSVTHCHEAREVREALITARDNARKKNWELVQDFQRHQLIGIKQQVESWRREVDSATATVIHNLQILWAHIVGLPINN